MVLTLAVLVGVPGFFLFYQAPTCFDGKHNGGEIGVDCGGDCQLLCTTESFPLVTKGDPRILEIAPGIFEVVALVENPNPSGEVLRARYIMTLYTRSEENPLKFLRSIEGETFIPKGGTSALFIGPMDLGEELPIKAQLNWHEDSLIWRRNRSVTPNISAGNIILKGEDSLPRIDATVVNNSLERVEHIELVALVTDESGNIIAASRTYLESLEKGESVPVVYTWPGPFPASTSTAVEIISKILPDRSYIR